MTLEQILDMTPEQVMVELGEAGSKPLSPIDLQMKAAKARAGLFDAICGRLRISRQQLATMPLTDLAQVIRTERPGKRLEEAMIPQWVAEYAAAGK
jgi:hypothetical protein